MFGFIRRSVKRNFGIDKEYYRFIDDMFGFIPNNIELYKVALIHKSASQSIGGHHINNERLEYLGDAVIESITSDYLFIAYPDRDEGFLTQMRSKIVSRQSLNEMAVFIGLDKYLICKSGVTLQQKHIYGDAFEAMIGAIYLDKGYEFTNRLLINDIFERFLSMDELSDSENDFKSRLIEWCQKNRHTLEFKTQKEIDKKSSNPIFYTTVLIDGIEMGHGTGDSKKSSEQKASCSVSHEMSDEECAKILDKFDRMMSQAMPSKPSAKPHAEPKPTKKQSVAEPAAEQHNEEAASDSGEHKPAENRRRGRKRKPANAAETEPAPATEASETAEVKETPSDAPKRRSRKKRDEQPAAPEHSEAETAAESNSESEEQPAKRRRGRRRKSETAPADSTAAPESANVQADEHPAENSGAEQQPKRRRGRRKKSETASAAAEGTATEGAAAAAE